GYEEDVIKDISRIEGVKSIVGTYGVYDLVANISSNTLQELNNSIAKIRKVNHVRSTVTLVVVEGQGIMHDESEYR
ncbi:MAG: hypothetical protein D6752_00300, partial [Candidatus Nitrosothermus koennekii]